MQIENLLVYHEKVNLKMLKKLSVNAPLALIFFKNVPVPANHNIREKITFTGTLNIRGKNIGKKTLAAQFTILPIKNIPN